jgi:hypothetical protein
MGPKPMKPGVKALHRAGAFLEGPHALAALEQYWLGRFTGAWFDAAGRAPDPTIGAPVDPDPNRFTIEDLLAPALIGLPCPNDTMIAVRDRNIDVAPLLARIDRSLTLADAPDPRDEGSGPWVAAERLRGLLRDVTGVNRARASALMARKRPHLIPMWDRHVGEALGLTKRDNDWVIAQQVVRAHGSRLAELRTEFEAAHPGDGRVAALSTLRVLELVVWMRARGARAVAPSLLLDRNA